MYLVQSLRKIGAKCRSCRVRGQNSKLSYRHSELGAVKVNNNNNNKLECSVLLTLLFIFFVLWKGKEKNSFLFFFLPLFTATIPNGIKLAQSFALQVLLCLYNIYPSVQFSHSVMSDSLQPHESQQARTPCPSPSLGVHSNSCPSSQ